MAIDPKDLTVMVPRVRRLVDGPTAMSPGSVASTFSDKELVALIADAIADVILASGGSFGHELVVTERDEDYGAPIKWQVEPALSESEISVVGATAALSVLYRVLANKKMSEELKDEGQSWSYQLSATVVRDWLKSLQGVRDAAILDLKRAGVSTDVYSSYMQVRDNSANAALESWVSTS